MMCSKIRFESTSALDNPMTLTFWPRGQRIPSFCR